jgi:hypothetical protein
LLDALRLEELARYKEAISAHLGVTGNAHPRRADPDVIEKAKRE